MKTKLIFLAAMVTLVLLAASVVPDGAEACSGDLCGCNSVSCMEECAFGPPEYLQECRAACRRETVRCAIRCCSGGGDGPPEV